MNDFQWMLAWGLFHLPIQRTAIETTVRLPTLVIYFLPYPASAQVVEVWAAQAAQEMSTICLIQ